MSAKNIARKIMKQIFMATIGLLGLAQSAFAQSKIDIVQADWPKQLAPKLQWSYSATVLDHRTNKGFLCVVIFDRPAAEFQNPVCRPLAYKTSLPAGGNVQVKATDRAISPAVQGRTSGVWQVDQDNGRVEFCFLSESLVVKAGNCVEMQMP
jgi:hypothetical protein